MGGRGLAGRTVVLAGVAAGLVLLAWAAGTALQPDVPAVDGAVHRSVTGNRPGWLVGVMQAVTTLGLRSVVTVAGLAVAVAVVRRGGHRRLAGAAILGPVGGELVNAAVKHLARRERPPVADALASADGFAFPSGHALVAAAGWGTMAWVWAASGRHGRRTTGTAAALVIAAVAGSRVVLGVHWLSDVAAGAAVGSAWALALRWWAAAPAPGPAQAGAPASTGAP